MPNCKKVFDFLMAEGALMSDEPSQSEELGEKEVSDKKIFRSVDKTVRVSQNHLTV
jgi:hypothetical protein